MDFCLFDDFIPMADDDLGHVQGIAEHSAYSYSGEQRGKYFIGSTGTAPPAQYDITGRSDGLALAQSDPQMTLFGGDALSAWDESVKTPSEQSALFGGDASSASDESVPTPSEQPAQASEPRAAARKERARNAANKRHSNFKKTKRDVHVEDDGDPCTSHRERNRLAAAKCRAKKKINCDHLQEIHRDAASKNKILKNELMGLWNELAQFKTMILEHSLENCQCSGI